MSGLLPCDPPWEGTGGARGMFGLSRLAMFPSTRVYRVSPRSVLPVEQTAVLPFC